MSSLKKIYYKMESLKKKEKNIGDDSIIIEKV
jgi:hypothetical protein